MQLAANVSLLYPDLPLEVRLAKAAAQGFSAVEILFPYDTTPDTLSVRLQEHDLQLVLVNTPLGTAGKKGFAALPGRTKDFLGGIDQALAVCKATGCRSVHVMAGTPLAGTPPETVRATLLDNLQRAVERAAPLGVTLTLEALNRHDVPGYCYHQPAQVVQILQALSTPAVRLQFDFYHTQREAMDLPSELATALPWIHHVQFANPAGRHEPDLQDPDVRQALRMLRDAGYTGFVGCEFTPSNPGDDALAWRADYLSL